MEIIDCHVRLNQQSTIYKTNVTPAEALLLMALHGPRSGGATIHDPVAAGEVDRSDQEEYERLAKRYNPTLLQKIFPASVPSLVRLPHSFADIRIVPQEASREAVPVPDIPDDPNAKDGPEDVAPPAPARAPEKNSEEPAAPPPVKAKVMPPQPPTKPKLAAAKPRAK
jgi:hypothetical protein